MGVEVSLGGGKVCGKVSVAVWREGREEEEEEGGGGGRGEILNPVR